VRESGGGRKSVVRNREKDEAIEREKERKRKTVQGVGCKMHGVGCKDQGVRCRV